MGQIAPPADAEPAVMMAEERPAEREAVSARYEPDAPPRSPLVQALRWPLHQALKAIFLLVAWLARSRKRALLAGMLVAALVGGTILLAQRSAASQPQAVGPGSIFAAPGAFQVTYNTQGLAPLPATVEDMLRAVHDYDAHAFWQQLDPRTQAALQKQGKSEQTYADAFASAKSQGIVYSQFIYTGGFVYSDGGGNYMVLVAGMQGNQPLAPETWYFEVVPGGKIIHFANVDALIKAFQQ